MIAVLQKIKYFSKFLKNSSRKCLLNIFNIHAWEVRYTFLKKIADNCSTVRSKNTKFVSAILFQDFHTNEPYFLHF